MRKDLLEWTMNICGAAALIALMALSGLAQETSQRSGLVDPCEVQFGKASRWTRGERATSRSGTKMQFLPVASTRGKLKCDFLPLASNKVPPINSEMSSQNRHGEVFNFESQAAKHNASAVTRTGSSAQAQAPPDSATEAQELAKKLSNPVASLISVPMQSNFDFGMGTGSGWRFTLNVQPVIPIALSPSWNLISRTITPIIHQGNVTGPNTSQNGLGDIVQSLFFSPNKSEPLVWAVGPVFLLPTATNAALGAQKWGVGPTALALKQKHGWTYGALANHIWSVAGKSSRSDVNATFVQPFLAYTNKQAWTYNLNTESTYDWRSESWSVPINFSVAKLVRFGKQPISFTGGIKCWVTTPTGGPEGCGPRITVTALFPK